MDLRFTPEELAFRDEMRTFFRENIPRKYARQAAARAGMSAARNGSSASAS